MSRDTPTNTDDMIDLDDVRERIEELESERADLVENLTEAAVDLEAAPESELDRLIDVRDDAKDALDEWDRDNGQELKDLTDFMSEADGLDGPMIRESYFTDYAMETAEQCCDMKAANSWPFNCIDWEQAARELQHDYTGADFNGVTYYGR